MTAAHPLFSFMPYGAPELLRDARGNLFRATLLSILAGAAALVLAAGIARTLVIPAPPPPVVEMGRDHVVLPPPPLQEPPAQRSFAHAFDSRVVAGVAVPTQDDLVREEVTIADQGTLKESSPSATGEGTPPVELRIEAPSYPKIDEYVYVEELPEPVVDPRPAYPEIALAAGVEGTVLVHALVDRDGKVVEVRANPKHTVPLLESAALDAARRWVFQPALANGHAVPVWVAIPFEFRLH